MTDISPPSQQRLRLLKLLSALDAAPTYLSRDDSGVWMISGAGGSIYALSRGIGPGQLPRKWPSVKRSLTFAKVTRDGDFEGAMTFDKIPSIAEAILIRAALRIRRASDTERLPLESLPPGPSLSGKVLSGLLRAMAGPSGGCGREASVLAPQVILFQLRREMTMDGEDFDDDTGGGDLAVAEDTTSRSDVEQALINQKQDRGDPEPRRSEGGRQLRGRADAGIGGNFEGLQSYHDEARKNGTTIQRAMSDYVAVENAIRENPVHGLSYLVQRLGMDPRQLSAAWAQANHEQLGPGYGQQMQQRVDQASISHDINEFAADPSNRYFAHARQDMARLVQAGLANDLKTAYRMAVSRNPQLRAQSKMDRSYAKSDRDKATALRRVRSYGGY